MYIHLHNHVHMVQKEETVVSSFKPLQKIKCLSIIMANVTNSEPCVCVCVCVQV